MGETQALDSSLPLILIGVIGMLLLSGAVIVFFVVYQKRLFTQKNKVRDMEAAHQQDLLESFIKAQEIERERVATNLHDGVGSLLSAIRLYMAQLSPETSTADYQEMLSETKSIVDSAITQTREISHNLLPTTLERFGVVQAMEDHCHRIHKIQGIEMTFDGEEGLTFTKQQDLALYRILQELTNNTLKHAEASVIKVSLSQTAFTYADNGKGMALDTQAGDGLGLKSIESRASLLKGKVDIQSAPGQGFKVVLSMPELAGEAREELNAEAQRRREVI